MLRDCTGIVRAIGLRLALPIVLCLAAFPLRADPPAVVVSVGPWHSLASGVLDGVADVALLLPSGHSPHEGMMAPSMMQAIVAADLVVWTGPALETALRRAVRRVPPARLITVGDIPGMRLLSVRQSGIHARAADYAGIVTALGGDAGNAGLPVSVADPHLWLSTHNAGTFVQAFAKRLSEIDPDNRHRYLANAGRLLERIEALRGEIHARLESLREAQFLVFHDAYQYFEHEFELKSVGAVTLNPSRAPGVRRVRELRRYIRNHGVRCVFREPQFEPRLLEVIAEDTGARTGVLDPLGAYLEPGAEMWFDLMRGLEGSLAECLEGAAGSG